MPLDHDLRGFGTYDQPVDQLRKQARNNQQGLYAFFRIVPVGRNCRRRDQRGVEIEMSEEEGRREDGGGRKVGGGKAGLEVAEGVAGESAEGSVA